MDTKSEDIMVRQIEKNLTNHMNENLFLSGRTLESKKEQRIINERKASFEHTRDLSRDLPMNPSEEYISNQQKNVTEDDYPLVSNDYISNHPVTLSRAEYIRQAREACLRQMSDSQIYCKPYESNYIEAEDTSLIQPNGKKNRAIRLFGEGSDATASQEEGSPQEIAAFRALIIRTVCAIVLFLLVFLVDKFNIIIGKVTPEMIQAYITGNDTLQELENFVVALLK